MNLAGDFSSVVSLVFILGLRHGLDADHLASIDSMTRYNSVDNPRLAKYCGLLFSLGHGVMVLLIALAVGSLSASLVVPSWLESCGAFVSITCLTLLGIMNLAAVATTSAHEPVSLAGIKSNLFKKLQSSNSPLVVAAVGFLFALSFDTISQAGLFAITGLKYGGLVNSIFLGLVFVVGMLLIDGLNGLWIAKLFASADQVAVVASRMMALLVGLFSLTIAFFGAIKYYCPQVGALSEPYQLPLGLSAVFLAAASACFMQIYARRLKANSQI